MLLVSEQAIFEMRRLSQLPDNKKTSFKQQLTVLAPKPFLAFCGGVALLKILQP